jgi:hypothetical protein
MHSEDKGSNVFMHGLQQSDIEGKKIKEKRFGYDVRTEKGYICSFKASI